MDLFARRIMGWQVQGCPFRGLGGGWLGGGGRREPGVAFECAGDGVEGGQAVGERGVEVAAKPAPALERGVGLPVPGHCLVAFGGLGSPLGDVGWRLSVMPKATAWS